MDALRHFEMGKMDGGAWEHCGEYRSFAEMIEEASSFGEGAYGFTADPDGGHYEGEIEVTCDGRVNYRTSAEQPWSEWTPEAPQ